jgi:hypothetical protein
MHGRVSARDKRPRAYLEAVAAAFGMGIDYAMLQKIYVQDSKPEKRYRSSSVSDARGRKLPAHRKLFTSGSIFRRAGFSGVVNVGADGVFPACALASIWQVGYRVRLAQISLAGFKLVTHYLMYGGLFQIRIYVQPLITSRMMSPGLPTSGGNGGAFRRRNQRNLRT